MSKLRGVTDQQIVNMVRQALLECGIEDVMVIGGTYEVTRVEKRPETVVALLNGKPFTCNTGMSALLRHRDVMDVVLAIRNYPCITRNQQHVWGLEPR